MDVTVAWISYTVVKGLRLQTVDEVDLTERGVPGDRRFYLIDERGHLTNAKHVGVLQQVEASFDEQAGVLKLALPGGATVAEPVSHDGEVTTSFYGRPVDGRRLRGAFSDALSDLAGKRLELIEATPAGSGIDRGRKGAISMLSLASLERLAQAAGVKQVDPRRFRMLFGIAGIDAHAEDAWVGREIQLGGAVVRLRGHVGRCVITARDPETGERTLDTLGALATYRRDTDTTERLPFGIYGEVLQPGRVRCGDPITLR